jgi:hypothetical protein
MVIYDDIYSWEGWGGELRLGSGKCRLRIFDLHRDSSGGLAHLTSIIVVVEDVSKDDVSVKSCAPHIATVVTKEFGIDPHRMTWVEYYPESRYGVRGAKVIPEKYETVEFTWHEDKAINPRWSELKPPLDEIVKRLTKE